MARKLNGEMSDNPNEVFKSMGEKRKFEILVFKQNNDHITGIRVSQNIYVTVFWQFI